MKIAIIILGSIGLLSILLTEGSEIYKERQIKKGNRPGYGGWWIQYFDKKSKKWKWRRETLEDFMKSGDPF